MISFTSKGDFKNMEKFLEKTRDMSIFDSLSAIGAEGVAALAAATPYDSGLTSSSWTYEIIKDSSSWSIVWGNTNVVDGRPIAILLQYGHGTGTGGYVVGRDYINPALAPIMQKFADAAWKVVTSA